MNFKTTLILLVLLAGVGIYLLFIRNTPEPTQNTSTEKGTKLVDVALADVRRLVVKPHAGARLVVERGTGDEWRLVEPVKAPAESWQVDTLVRSVTDLLSHNRLDLEAGKAGLDQPQYQVELTDKGGTTHSLSVGSKSTVGDILYVRSGDQKQVDVVDASFAEQLDKPASTYRQKKLLDIKQDQVRGLALNRPEGELRVEKQDAAWRITEPKAMPADGMQVSNLLSALVGLNAEDFVAEDGAKAQQYGLDKPSLTISLTMSDAASASTTRATTSPAAASQPAPTIVRFGRYEDLLKKDLYVQVQGGPVARIAATTLDSFKKSALDLRDRSALDVDPERVNKLMISREMFAATQPTNRPAEHGKIVLARREEKLIPAGPPAPPKTESPAPIVDPPALKFEAPASKSNSPAAPKNVSPTPGKSEPKVDVRTPGGDGVVRLALFEEAPAKVDNGGAVDPAKPQAADAAEPSTAPVTGAATAPAVPAAPPTVWVLQSNPKGDADDAKVQGILDAIHPLKTEKYLDSMPKDLKPVGSYVLKIDAASKGEKPAQTIEIKLTDPGADKKLVAVYGDAIFEVDRSFADKISGDFTKKKGEVVKPPTLPPNFGGPDGLLPPGQ